MPLDALVQTQGRNYAPAEPLRHAKDALRNGGHTNFGAFFRECCQQVELEDELAWRQHLATGYITAALRSGKKVLKRDFSGDGYFVLDPKPAAGMQDRSNYPIFPAICEELKAKWEKWRPGVAARAFGDGYRTELQLDQIDRVNRSYFRNIFTSQYELNEALSAQDFGTYVTRFWYDDKFNQMRDLMPILRDSTKVIDPGYAGCLSCPFEGTPEDFSKTGAPMPQCPDCGGYNTTDMVHPRAVQTSDIVGVEEIVQGDIRGAGINFPAFKFDLRVLAHESGYKRYEQYMPLRVARQTFGDLNFERASSTGGDHYGLELMNALSSRGGNTDATGASELYYSPTDMGRKVVFREYWFKPEWYAGFKLDKEERTVAGTIPADVDFAELFPEGVCVSGFNSMNLITGFYAEKSRFVSGVYYLMSFSGLGKGLSDAVDIATNINTIWSMAMAGVDRHAASGVVVDKALGLTASQVRRMFTPQGVVFADVKKAGYDDIRKGVQKLQFDAMNEVLPATIVQLSNLLHAANLSGDFSEGTLQQVNIDTLGGQQLATAKEEGKKGAILAMKGFHRELSAAEITDLVRTHIKSPVYYPEMEDKQARSKGVWISGADFPEDVRFDAIPESAAVQNDYERRIAYRQMLKDAGGIVAFMQVAQAAPEMAAFLSEQYGVKIPMLDQGDIWRVCLSRLDDIKQLSEGVDDPAEILGMLTKPVFQDEKWHLVKADFLSAVLDDDEVETWNPAARGAVQLLIKTHKDLQRAIQLDDEIREQNAQGALASRGAQMQAAAAAPVAEQQQETETHNALLGAAQDVGIRILDDEQKQVDHDRQREDKQDDYALQLERDDIQGERQERLASMKQPPTQGTKPQGG